VTQNDSITATGKRRQSAIDGRTTRHEGHGMSQSRRAMTECIFGWGKQHGTMRKTKHRGMASVATDFSAQSDRLQSDPHSQTAGGVARVRSQREKLFPASENTPQPPKPKTRQKDGKCATFQVLQQTAKPPANARAVERPCGEPPVRRVREELVKMANEYIDLVNGAQLRRAQGRSGQAALAPFRGPEQVLYAQHRGTCHVAHVRRTSYLPDDLPLLSQGNRASYR